MATAVLTCAFCGETWVERLRSGASPDLCRICRERPQGDGMASPQRMVLVEGPRIGDLPAWHELLGREAPEGDSEGGDASDLFAAALLRIMDNSDAEESGHSSTLSVCNCRACETTYAGPGPYELCHRCTLARERGSVSGGAHGVGLAVRKGCRCAECVDGLAAGLEMVTRRCQGETLRSIGQAFGLTRERVRQITVKVAPWEPWEAIRRADAVELAEVRRVHELAVAELANRPCDVCGQIMEQPSQNRRFCSTSCRKVWDRLSYHTDSDRRAQAKRAQARYAIENADRLPDTQVRFARRVISGEVGTDREFRWMVEGTTAFKTAVDVVLKDWPIACGLPASIRRQIYEHLGWEWDGDPAVPSGSDSLRDAAWIGAPRADGAASPYSDVLTKEFLEEAYLDAGFSGSEVAELVGCAVGTVYSALRRFGIPRRGGQGSTELGDVLTAEFLQAQYVDAGRSGTSIAEEIGCDPSTVYSALKRHGIATRGSQAETWRDIPELVDPALLEEAHAGRSTSPAEIASSLGLPQRHVLDALTHHGLIEDERSPRDYRSVLTEAFLTETYLEKGLSGNAIADEVGCHPTTVYEALRRHGIKAQGQGGHRTHWGAVLTKEYLLDAYVEQGLSGGRIAEDVGCTSSVVYAWLERHGIERREARATRTQSGAVNWDPEWLREQYLGRGRSGADIADELGVPTPTLYSALRRYGIRRQ